MRACLRVCLGLTALVAPALSRAQDAGVNVSPSAGATQGPGVSAQPNPAPDPRVNAADEPVQTTTVIFDSPASEIDGRAETPLRMLEVDLALLEQKRLAQKPATSVDELAELLERAHARVLAGRKDEAALLLLEAVDGPRYRAFESFPEYGAAELMLASLLIDRGALVSAQREVDRLLARGKQSASFGPAYRRAVDIALSRGDYANSARVLRELVPAPLPEDAQNELHYLDGLAAYDDERVDAAQRELAAISKKSRFYARAEYLLGALAARRRAYDEASARFCAVRRIEHGAPRTRYESSALYPTEDLATLGMGRVAHEQGRQRAAFQHYFAIPNDSPLIAEALFESAYASYERGRPQSALDSLQQLEARYPDSPYTAEARVLRGYVHLASCDFDRAERELAEFEQTFGGVLTELRALLESTASVHRLYSERAAHGRDSDALLRGLVTRDPQVERLRRELAELDAEIARSSGVGAEFSALAMRVRNEQPHERGTDESEVDPMLTIARMREKLKSTQAAVDALASDLSRLREQGASGEEPEALRAKVRTLRKRCDAIAAALRKQVRARERAQPRPTAALLAERLQEERSYVEAVQSGAQRVRDQLEEALNRAERRALEQLEARLEKELRRARIGRIDAVMGKKRKLELEVESLAAGRFPPELSLSKTQPEWLRDDQEYWPYEGEDWPDEFQEQP